VPKVVDKAAYFEKVGYKPHPKQWLFHNSRARFRVPCCGRRFGKSRMAGMDVQPLLHVPERRVWIVGPTYDLSEKEFRVVWDTMMVKLKYGQAKGVKKAYNKKQGEMYIEFPWRTRIECRSADHPENLVGESLDHVIMSEAAKHKKDTWERYIRAALSDRRGTADFPTTPEGYNWYHKIWQQGLDSDEPDFESWRFPSWENPFVFPDGRQDSEIKLVERTTTKAWFDQEYGADFSAFVGKIFSDWQEDVHVRAHRFNPDWPNYGCFDWGFTNPLAFVEFQVDPWGGVHVWREHYKAYWRLEQHIQFLKDRANPEGYRLDLTFGDAADPGAASYVTKHFAPCYAMPEAKSGTPQPNKDDERGKNRVQSGWREGIELVGSYLKIPEPSDVIDDLGEMTDEESLQFAEAAAAAVGPLLHVDPACKNLVREFNNYRAPASTGNTDRNVREAAQAYDDHALDALRYGMMHVFKLGVQHHLEEVYNPHDFQTEKHAAGSSTGGFTGDSGYFNTGMSF
jgi:hypothetical protein